MNTATYAYTLSQARAAYKRNHSDLRAIVRFSPNREKALAEECRSRQFWLRGWDGNSHATPGGQAALLTLSVVRCSTDPLALKATVQPHLDVRGRKTLSRIVTNCLRMRPNK